MGRHGTRQLLAIAFIVGLMFVTIGLTFFISTTVGAAKLNESEPQHSITPWATRTPCNTCTPPATRTPWWTPWPTRTPCTTCTPRPTLTAWPTRTPCNSCTPLPTRTPWWTPWPTRTALATRTPCNTCTPPATRTPWATRTPCTTCTPPPPPPTRMGTITPRPTPPIVLRPRMQFGYANPGETRTYNQGVVNRMQQPVTVDLTVESLNGWTVSVDPTQVVALPGVPEPLTVSVQVPESPEYNVDLARTTASIDSPTYATHAYIVTIVHRQDLADLTQDHWADGPVQYLLDRGVVTGYSDGTYRPNENVTRAQFAKMIVGAMDWPMVTPASASFGDVAPDHWAYGFIETAAAHGIISGYSDGTFRPQASVTRAQVAKMIVTARDWATDIPASGYTDVHPTDWYNTYVGAMSQAEVISGYSDGTFRPNAPATRAQIAKILTFSLFSDPNN